MGEVFYVANLMPSSVGGGWFNNKLVISHSITSEVVFDSKGEKSSQGRGIK